MNILNHFRHGVTTFALALALLPAAALAQAQKSSLSAELKSAVQMANDGIKGNKGTVLVVVSAADFIKLSNGKSHATGYFLRELTDPLKEILLSDYDVEFATPGGKTPVVDVNSLKLAWYRFPRQADAQAKLSEATALKNALDVLNGRRAPKSLEEAALHADKYAGLLVPGGHAPMVDLRGDKYLGAIIERFHRERKPMGFVCHGPIALLSAQTGADWPFKGYRVSVVSTADEKLLESNVIAPIIGRIEGTLTEYADQELEKAGAILSISPVAGTPSLSRDRELVTAQNPAGATPLGKILVKAMAERKGERAPDSSVAGLARITLADLAGMSRAQLTNLYSRGVVDRIPLGDTVGMGLIFSGNASLNYLSAYVWQGKVFAKAADGKGVELVNRILGSTEVAGHTVDARVFEAPSLFDGRPSIRLDYGHSDVALARPIIDEIRKIGPDLYLGRVTFSGVDLGFFTLYFIE